MGVWECSTGQWAKAICSAGKAWVRPVKPNPRYFSLSVSLHLILSILPPCQKSNSEQGQLYFESYSRHAWRGSLQSCYRGARPPSRWFGGSDRSEQRTQFRKNLLNKLKKWRNLSCERLRRDRRWTRLGLIRTQTIFTWFQSPTYRGWYVELLWSEHHKKNKGEFPLPPDQLGPFIKGVVWV